MGNVGKSGRVQYLTGGAEGRAVAARESQFGSFGVECSETQLAFEAREQPARSGRLPSERDDEHLVGAVGLA